MSEASTTSPLQSITSPESNNNGVHYASSATPPSNSSTTQAPPQPEQPAAPASNGLNVRSCVTCRKRKVKCNKRHPCSNCNKAGIECIFPGPGRAPRRSRKPPDTELLARLRRLEGFVQTLGKGIDEENEPETESATVSEQPHDPATLIKEEDHEPSTCGQMLSMHEPGKVDPKTNGMINEFGKLVVDKRRSRYVSSTFWTSLSEEVAELQDILDDPTDEEGDYPSPESSESSFTNTQGFLFSFSSTILSLRDFHPAVNQILIYWETYKSNIDPVMKIVHVPHAEKLINAVIQDLDHVSKPMEALLFSVYFAAVTTMSDDECLMRLGIERPAALRKYRFATEQAFARANFMNTQDIMVLVALVLFLTAVRRTDDSRYVWTMTGLLIRLATSLGLHRDGAQFGLTPFSTEMRRRVWWQICILDVRAAEDQGCEPSISEQTFDTKFPLNVNDDQFDVDSKVAPEEQEGVTEMTFDLIRYSVSTTVRHLSFTPGGPGICRYKAQTATLEEKEHIIEEMRSYVENKYLRHLDTNVPLQWISATVARLIMAKMWLVVHHPLKRSDGGRGLPDETRARMFQTSVEVIDFSRLLETEVATRKWGWLFRTYVQWQALAFVLSQLCIQTEGADVDRAWMVVEEVFNSWGHELNMTKRGMMWKPLRKLMARARIARNKSLQQRALFPLDGRLGPAITPLITQPGPMMNGSSAGDYFSVPDSASLSPDDLQRLAHENSFDSGDSTLHNLPGLNNFVNPTDLSSFMSQPTQQTPSSTNGTNMNGNGIISFSTDSKMPKLNGNDPNIWEIPNNANSSFSFTYSNGMPEGLNANGTSNDTLMDSNESSAWDELVREFQMDSTQGGGTVWGGVEI